MGFLKLNDWDIRRFLWTVTAVQAAMLILAGAYALGLDIPGLRYFIGFVYLTFIPGIIILRILRMHQLGIVRTLLYAVGLSLAFNMFLGFIINFLYPYLGITKPISTGPVLITWTIVLGMLCFVCYRKDKDFGAPIQFNSRNLFSAPILLFALLPLVAILGTQLVNSRGNNLALMLLMIAISLVPVLLVATRLVTQNYYALIVYMISISLLFHITLISNNISGWDIRLEYYMYQVVVDNGFWSSIVPSHPYNGVLSVTILPAIYSIVLNMEGTWIFKVILPLFFSFVPLALFQFFQKQFGRNTAFLAVFYFMAVQQFFLVLPQLGKQLMAEVFFAIFLVALLDDKLHPVVKKFLMLIFGASIVVSHYGTAYLFMLVIFVAYMILFVLRNKSAAISITLGVFFIVLSLAWYLYNAGGVSADALFGWAHSIYDGLGEFFLDPLSRYSLNMITGNKLPLHQIITYLYLISQFLIAIGFSAAFLNWIHRKKAAVSNEYMALSAVLFIFLVLSAVMPRFSGLLDIARSFHVTLFLLAPFCVYGSEIIVQASQRLLLKLSRLLVHSRHLFLNHNNLLIPFSLFLLPFFLLTTGFMYEVFNDPQPVSIALSRNKLDRPVFSKRDVAGGTWLLDSRKSGMIIYCDPHNMNLFNSYVGPVVKGVLMRLEGYGDNLEVTSKVPANSYVYLREFNVKTGQLVLWVTESRTAWARDMVIEADLSSLAFYHTIQDSNVIYTNGGSLIYYTRTDYSPP